MARLFRAKASRPEYRRAGLFLGSAAWCEPFDLDGIGVGRMAILAGDPVVVLQVQEGDDTAWEPISAVARASFADAQLQVVDPEPTAEGGPSWADVEAARQEIDAAREFSDTLKRDLRDHQSRIAELEGEVGIERANARAAEKATEAANRKVEALQKQVDGLKTGLAAARAKAKPAPAAEKGPVDPPAGDQTT